MNKYVITGIIQGVLAALVQYIYQELDPVIGTALMLVPLSIVNIGSIEQNRLPKYIITYIYSTIFSLSMATLFYFLLKRKGRSTRETYTQMLEIIALCIISYVMYMKSN